MHAVAYKLRSSVHNILMLPSKPGGQKKSSLKQKKPDMNIHTHSVQSELRSRSSPGRPYRSDFCRVPGCGLWIQTAPYSERPHAQAENTPLRVHLKQPAPGSWIMMDVTQGSSAQKPSHMLSRGQVGVWGLKIQCFLTRAPTWQMIPSPGSLTSQIRLLII